MVVVDVVCEFVYSFIYRGGIMRWALVCRCCKSWLGMSRKVMALVEELTDKSREG